MLIARFLITTVFFLNTISCVSKQRAKNDNQNFTVKLAIPELFKLDTSTYPVGKCIPIQIQAVDVNDRTNLISLKKDVPLEITPGEFGHSDFDIEVYSEKACSEKTNAAILPASDLTPSMVKVYTKSEKEGASAIRISYDTGVLTMKMKFRAK